MTKYYYIPEEYKRYYDDELQHFDFKFPDARKFINNIANDASKAISDISKNISNTINKIGQDTYKAVNDAANNVSKIVSGTLGGGTGREWKKHKWIARKRNKDGKWIYDYGNGFPGENKLGSTKQVYLNPNEKVTLYEPSAVQKFLAPIVGLGRVLVGVSLDDSIKGARDFIGGFQSMFKRMKVDELKADTKEDEHGLRLKKNDQGKEFDLKMANPEWDNNDGGSQNNCPCCSVAYDLRRRGYEVTAKQTMVGLSEETVSSFYKNPKIYEVTPNELPPYTLKMTDSQYIQKYSKKLTQAVTEQFENEPNNTRGMAYVTWSSGGGHIFSYEKENNKTVFYDAQCGEKIDIPEYVDNSIDFHYFRTDNLEPNYDQVKKVIE